MRNTDPIILENGSLISVYMERMSDIYKFSHSAKNETERENLRRFSHYLKYRDDQKWFGRGNNSAVDVLEHAALGDAELYKSLKSKIDLMDKELGRISAKERQQKIQKPRRKIKWNSHGDEIDIHKVYGGKLDQAWRRTEPVPSDVKKKLITLFIDISGYYNQRVEDSMWRAVAACKLCNDLLSSGKSVRILVGGSSHNTFVRSHKEFSSCVVVKEYNESLTMEKLAAMCHLGFYRSFCFAAKFMQMDKRVNGSLGGSNSMRKELLPINLQKEIDDGHTNVTIIGKSLSMRDAIQSLKNAMEDLTK